MCWRAERPAPAGFVLMEAVVALAIIGLFSVALLSTTSAQLQTAGKANTLLVARSLAEDRLAALRLLEYEELGDVPDSLVSGTFPAPFEAWAWTASVEEMEDEYDLFGAEVIVEGRGETFPLRTLIHAPRPVVQVGAQGGAAVGGATGGRGGQTGRAGGARGSGS
jgi:type II secretory pathway pseudopilin PulG